MNLSKPDFPLPFSQKPASILKSAKYPRTPRRQGSAIAISNGKSWTRPGATVIMRNSTFTGNIADIGSAGTVNVGEFATARFEGDGNTFTGNVCGTDGGVLAATTDTSITVEGGWFEGNEAKEVGGECEDSMRDASL